MCEQDQYIETTAESNKQVCKNEEGGIFRCKKLWLKGGIQKLFKEPKFNYENTEVPHPKPLTTGENY